MLIVLLIDVVRIKSLPTGWRTTDGYEMLSLILISITGFSNHPFQRGIGASLVRCAPLPKLHVL